MTGRQSFSTQALILSGPGDLFIGRDVTIRRTSSSDTVRKLNNSIEVVSMPFSDEKSRTMMFSLKHCAASAAFKPTLAKNLLNSLVKTATSFVKAGLCLSLEGMARLIIFQSEPELFLLAVTS